jgi:hypothetical protein
MKRRSFLLGLCGLGGAAAIGAKAPTRGSCEIVNKTERTIYLKIVGYLPGFESHSETGGLLFPNESYFDDLAEGRQVVLAWDHTGREIVTNKELDVVASCRIEVVEGDAVLTYRM